jgi:Ca2+-binding RTX toxin-like protein
MARIFGTPFDDVLVGTNDPDEMFGGNGHDSIVAGGGNDLVYGGAKAFTGIGQIRVVNSGADRIIQGNNDSDMQADFEIVLVGFNTAVQADDFSAL